MPLSNEEKNRIDGIEEAVNGQTPVEDLNEEREKNRSFESRHCGHVMMGKWITPPEERKPKKNAPNEFDRHHSPKHMGNMPRYPRPSLKEFLKKLFGKK